MVKDLYAMDINQEGVIAAVEGGARSRLTDLGLRVGKRVKIVTRQPLRGPVVVQLGEVTLSLGKGLARKITVEVIE